MKVLILTTALNGNNYNGCGWIGSCIEHLSQVPDLQLGIGYLGKPMSSNHPEISFFPIQVWNSRRNRLTRRFHLDADEKLVLPEVRRIIEAFQPDIIHIFGSENPFGLVASVTTVPVLIHLQGFLPSYFNAKYPPGLSCFDIFFSLLFKNPLAALNFRWREKMYRHCVQREFAVIRGGQYFCGRTAWDHAIIEVINPRAEYFYCSEFLRQPFHDNAGKWQPQEHRPKIKIISVSSPATFKGVDVILKTAKWLQEFTDIDFEWNIFGVSDAAWQDSFWGYLHGGERVKCRGTASAEKIVQESLASDIFVHTSYIDNSPNSICEAQLLGMPVIGTNAGGVSSIIEDGVDGLLVPANDPMMLACRIKELSLNSQRASELGQKATQTAQRRHNPENITEDLLHIYHQILIHKK